MGNVIRNFIKGRMNKSVDERLVPNGEYIDALNVRLGSTEASEIGSVENSKGNTVLTTLQFDGVNLSPSARCIGALEDGVKETVYWFVNDPANTQSSTGIVDLIVSYNINNDQLTYHVVSTSILNFNATYLITGVDKVNNLLFFTDDYNEPRKINVTRNYPEPIAYVDQFLETDIAVIKKPPLASPTLKLIDIPGEEDYLETNFVSFAYRYKYVDDEYSALSQFTDVAFESSPFSLSPATNFNDGMLNRYNTAVVGMNTAGSDVVGIDLCFKLGSETDIRVVQKYIKSEVGWPDNATQTINFTNQQIYTLLPSSEILRLYDNVPLRAQAQTIMGNRLIYGNYVDGHALTISGGSAIDTNYSAEVVSENLTAYQEEGSVTNGINYGIDTTSPVVPGTNSEAVIEFATAPSLVAGGVFGFSFTVTHQAFSGSGQTGSYPITIDHPTFSISFVFNLPQAYGTVYEMVNSPEFQSQIGANGSGTYQPATGCANGSTLTDVLNCSIIAPAGYTFINSGISALSQGVIISSSGSTPNEFGVTILGVQYSKVSDGNNQYFEYFRVSNVTSSIQLQPSNKSLHSNRDYEVGVVYMDSYKRATTVLTSRNNTVFIPPANSSTINKIKATIPTNMTAPSWAETYKFVLKQSKGAYETIYTTTYYYDPSTTSYWLRLVGQDQALVEAGTELIVKSDANGIINTDVKVVVLDKVSQPENFLHPSSTEDFLEQPGVYMRIKAQGFSINPDISNLCYPEYTNSVNNVIDDNTISLTAVDASYQGRAVINYPCYTGNASDGYQRIAVPSGAVVRIQLEFRRDDSPWPCPAEDGASLCRIDRSFTSNQAYSDIKEFWDNEGLGSIIINEMNCEVADQYDGGPNANEYDSTYYDGSNPPGADPNLTDYPSDVNKILFYTISDDDPANPENQRLFLRCVNGTPYSGCLIYIEKASRVTVQICIQELGSVMVFETEPTPLADGVFYEGSKNYAITGGYHQGNVTNQDATTEGVVDLSFFNCYAFGNGVESYKIEDSSIAESFELGHRALLVSAQDYKEADRFADMTYSGVYNDESNVNRLNEFNQGLLNFKALEDVYGPIQKMVARETDVLVLQEDRISYVLANKDAITSSGGLGILTSVPLVLGQQIARVEEYGISANPESYAEFGFDKYFTDAKRGVVIQLRGTSLKDEQLSVVSHMGMRSWFRDLFNSNFDTQKLGGYDPYMDEYAIASNDIKLPIEVLCLNCGITQDITVPAAGDTVSFCVNLGAVVGQIIIDWGTPILAGGVTFDVDVLYDGITYSRNAQTGPPSPAFVVDKDSVLPDTLTATITANAGAIPELPFTVNCPTPTDFNVILVSLNLDWQNSKTIHNEFRFIDGTTLSPTYQSFVTFLSGSGNPVLSQYQVLNGPQGTSVFPPNGSTVYVQSNKIAGDTFNYDPTGTPPVNKLQYYRGPILYTEAQIDTLLAQSLTTLTVTPGTTGSALYSGNFTLGASGGDNLYLIYDYSTAKEAQLCFGNKLLAACCDCVSPGTYYLDGGTLMEADGVYTDDALTVLAPTGYYQGMVADNSIVRYQDIADTPPLGLAVSCASCDRDCRNPDSIPPASVTLTQESVYDITYDLGVSGGAVIIRFSPGIPNGIFVTYDAVTTSRSSGTTYPTLPGQLSGPYYGDDTTGTPTIGALVPTASYVWNNTDDVFDAGVPATTPITIVAGDLTSLTTGSAGDYVLYVSKPNSAQTPTAPTTLTIRVVSPRPFIGDPGWSLDVSCPTRLSSFSSSNVRVAAPDICIQPFAIFLFNIPVTSASTYGVPNIRDWVFLDVLGDTKAPIGYYRVSGYYIEVDANGIIVDKQVCI